MKKLALPLLLLALSAVLVAAAGTALAAAPPTYVASEPADEEELQQAPDNVSITFDQPLDPDSAVMVEDHCGNRIDDRDTTVTGNQMDVDLVKGPAGMYHVTYYAKGVEGVTGQKTGIFTFTVHAGPSCGKGAIDHDHGGGGGQTAHKGHGNHGSGNAHGNGEHGAHGGSGAHLGGATHGAHSGMADGTQDHSAHGSAAEDHGDHAAREPGARAERGPGSFASTEAPGIPRADIAAAITALVLSALVGTLGGWVLRVSARAS